MKKKEKVGIVAPSGKDFLPNLKKVASVVGRISYLILAMPFKLPMKLLQLAKYVGVVAGVVQESTKDESSGIKMGMLSGMSLSLYVLFPWSGIIETSILAATGALVSFVVGRLLQWMVRKRKG